MQCHGGMVFYSVVAFIQNEQADWVKIGWGKIAAIDDNASGYLCLRVLFGRISLHFQ